MSRELLQQALDALEPIAYEGTDAESHRVRKLRHAIRAHLAQPQAEPTVVHQFRRWGFIDWYDGCADHEDGGGPYEERTLYTHPAAPAPAVPPGYVLVPVEPTTAMISAMMTSKARDAEGAFPMLMDHLDYSGENKSHTVLKAAYRAMIAAAPAPAVQPSTMCIGLHEALKSGTVEIAAAPSPVALTDAVNALLHQIDIGDFVDSNGHSAKMLKPVHDLMRLLAAQGVPHG